MPSREEIGILEDIGKMQSRILKDSDSTIAIDKFSKEINKLLGDDNAQDALFSYQTKHNVFFGKNKVKQDE